MAQCYDVKHCYGDVHTYTNTLVENNYRMSIAKIKTEVSVLIICFTSTVTVWKIKSLGSWGCQHPLGPTPSLAGHTPSKETGVWY